jgi:hypothetical protein
VRISSGRAADEIIRGPAHVVRILIAQTSHSVTAWIFRNGERRAQSCDTGWR